jgi:hypothetical protein
MNLIKPIYAAITNPVLTNQKINENPKSYVNSAIQTIISIFFIFGLVYFIYHFILAGYKMIASQGDPKKYEEAQHALLYSLIGIIIIFSVFALLKLVGTIFGITGLDGLTITWPSL